MATPVSIIPGAVEFIPSEEFTYWNFFLDWGPLSLGNLYRFCQTLNFKLRSERHQGKVIYVFSGPHAHKRANGAFLLCAWQLLYCRKTPEEAFLPFRGTYPPFPPFHDASPGICTYDLTIMDCLRGLSKACYFRFFDFNTFDVEEYEHYEQVENGDLNWLVDGKFLAFAGPHRRSEMTKEGYHTLTPRHYVPYFKKHNVTLVVRLNQKYYDENQFVEAGIAHEDAYFIDGSVPPPRVLQRFIAACEATPGAIAVHCKAGLGRTGTCIGCYLMKHYGFTAAEVIGWMRVCRPGSVIGHQQQYLQQMEVPMHTEGMLFRQRVGAATSSPGRPIHQQSQHPQQRQRTSSSSWTPASSNKWYPPAPAASAAAATAAEAAATKAASSASMTSSYRQSSHRNPPQGDMVSRHSAMRGPEGAGRGHWKAAAAQELNISKDPNADLDDFSRLSLRERVPVATGAVGPSDSAGGGAPTSRVAFGGGQHGQEAKDNNNYKNDYNSRRRRKSASDVTTKIAGHAAAAQDGGSGGGVRNTTKPGAHTTDWSSRAAALKRPDGRTAGRSSWAAGDSLADATKSLEATAAAAYENYGGGLASSLTSRYHHNQHQQQQQQQQQQQRRVPCGFSERNPASNNNSYAGTRRSRGTVSSNRPVANAWEGMAAGASGKTQGDLLLERRAARRDGASGTRAGIM